MKTKYKSLLVIGGIIVNSVLLFTLVFITNKTNVIRQSYLAKAKDQTVVTESNEKENKKDTSIIEEKVDAVLLSTEKEIVRNEVFDGMTIEELSAKIDRSLNSTISGKGTLIATHSIELGIDPYLVTGIMLLETGCKWDCSYIVKQCNNVGGQKGSGCGAYAYYPTLDEGIIGYIDNLYYNYYNKGLTTPELMNSKYAASNTWALKVNNYISQIKAN